MDWLKDILKHLEVSKVLVGAIFVTSVAMFWGPKIAGEVVPPIKIEWTPIVFAAMVLSGCLLVFWGISGIWSAISRAYRTLRTRIAASKISVHEAALLAGMGLEPGGPFRLDRVDYSQMPFSRLELMAVCRSLANKGLVRISEFDSAYVYLTESGRDRALEIHRASRDKID